MNWIELKNQDQLDLLQAESKKQPVLIFKHSTTCSISQTTLARLERNWNEVEMNSIKPYYLDLLSYRNISNRIAGMFDVEHQSPQVIMLRAGEVVFHKSHFEINMAGIKQAMLATVPIKN